MRLLVTGGGTGGHVYPALSVLEALWSEEKWATDPAEVGWVGGTESMEQRIIDREELAFYPISVGAVRGTGPLTKLRNMGRLAIGTFQAGRLISQFRPDVILATGGYVSVPLVLAGWAAKCPSLIYLPDAEPGLAVKFLTLFATRIALSFEGVAGRFPVRKTMTSGYPVRRALFTTSKAGARTSLGLTGERPVLLILGGSRGAHSINVAVRRELVSLLGMAQILHISGLGDYEELNRVRTGLNPELRSRYHLFSYAYDHMIDALVSADLVIARAGAAVLGEFPAVGLPAILVPYPYAGQHQQSNAEYLAKHNAAIIVPDGELEYRLLPALGELLGDATRLQTMAAASRDLALPDAARSIAEELFSLATGRGDG
jgi:UDP-N-acetylglucosamine--N-acetylmuramyl-(pentapeptide) pyrophosphoryl-undecaprenol N-acetylglucosamine transferase